MLPLLFYFCVFTAVLGIDRKSGISQFLADDYKVFDQMYGRTSDKDLYGMALPPTMTYNFDITKPLQHQSFDMKEHYVLKEKVLDPQIYNDFDDKNSKLFSNYLYTKKAKPALQFISLSDLKSISESNDPDTYNYLKHLEQMDKLKQGVQMLSKLKSKSHDSDTEADEAYKSIQKILDAHEANKKESSDSTENKPKTKKANNGRNKNKVRQINGNGLGHRTVSPRFKRYPPAHTASRPYIRKIRYHFTD